MWPFKDKQPSIKIEGVKYRVLADQRGEFILCPKKHMMKLSNLMKDGKLKEGAKCAFCGHDFRTHETDTKEKFPFRG